MMDGIALRRALIEKEYGFLNEQQRQAVFQIEGPLLVLAGAGSGKTSVLTNRIAYMLRYGDAYHAKADPCFSGEQIRHLEACLETGLDQQARAWLAESPVSPHELLAITFTNKAAREMRERLERLAGEEASGVWVSTFHSACCRILRRDIEKIGYSRSFTIYDDEDQLGVIKECLKTLNLSDKDFAPREIRARISGAKTLVQSPEELMQVAGDFRTRKIAELYAAYEERLRKMNALDFDDLLLKTLQLFADHPPVLEHYARRFRYILVDEYQDTNRMQYLFVHLLARRSQNLCVVGDDDQSIYGWRGADISNILDFEKDYKGCQTIKLEQNYRSTNGILSAANAVIGNNLSRKKKELWSAKGEGEKAKYTRLSDEMEEAGYICGEILTLRGQGLPFGEMAVLYRTNAQSRVLEERLVFSGIPYSVYGGLRFYERKEIKDVVCYLRLCANPADDVALRRVINEPRRGIGEATVESLAAYARQSGETMLGAAMDAEQVEGLAARAKAALSGFGQLMGQLLAHKELLGPAEFTAKLLELTGIRAQYDKDEDESRARFENIGELLGAVAEYEKMAETPTIEGFLEEAALVADVDGLREGTGSVTLMTMHSAKGLEFGAVFVTGMEEGLFPGTRAIFDEEKLEEERRLCYVAITRAKERLFFTNATRRMLYGAPQHNRPSRFLDELPETLVEREDRSAPWPSELRRSRARGEERENKERRELPRAGETPALRKPSQVNMAAGADFGVGDAVRHRRYGQGMVVKLQGDVAHVAFPGLGIKEFDLRFAPMEKA